MEFLFVPRTGEWLEWRGDAGFAGAVVRFATRVDEKGDENYTIQSLEPCCADFKGAHDEEFFDLEAETDGPHCVAYERYHDYDGLETRPWPIHFCPFCGKPVTLLETSRVREVVSRERVAVEQVKRSVTLEPAPREKEADHAG